MTAEWTLFSSKVTNLIQSVQRPSVAGDPAGVTTRSVYSNVGRANLKGSELNMGFRVAKSWDLLAGWDYLDATDAATGARLTQRARHTVRFGGRFEQGPWRFDAKARYLKGYYASNAVTPPTPTPAPIDTNFGTADIKLDYAYSKALSLSAGVDNLLNRRQPSNYSATGSVQDPPARFIYVGARYRF
jgi:outer membrane receptor protein involved in Fe transport